MKELMIKSRFEYSQDELDINKVLIFNRNSLSELHRNGELLAASFDAAIARAEELARHKGISNAKLESLRFQAANEPGIDQGIPEPVLSWEEYVSIANAEIPGSVILEDICSSRDFEEARRYIKEIEAEFKHHTKLTKMDLIFIPIAIALQCARQYALQPFLDKHRLTHKQNDALVKKIIPKSWQDILCASVPYDAITRVDKTAERTGLGGSNHRYRTLGHDPVLGWLFGPVNILSDTLTKSDFITSYEVVDMEIGKRILTLSALDAAYEQAKIEFNLPVSIAKQAVHFGSDYFTKQGLPLPVVGSLNNDVSGFLVKNNINMLNITQGAMLSTFINSLVSCVHGLFNTKGIDKDLYEVRTRKILSVSNTIASASNIAYVAITKNVKYLDIGGLLVTIRRLCTDLRFIARIKQEFIEGKLDADFEMISQDIDRLCGRS